MATIGVINSKVYTGSDFVLPKASGSAVKTDITAAGYGWKDMTSSIKTRTGGATVPSFAVYESGLYSFAFDSATAVQEVFNEFHMLHDYPPGTNLYIHTHWSTIATATGNINWMFELSYAKGYNQGPFEGTAGTGAAVIIPVTTAGSTAKYHMISEVQCSISGGLVSSAVNVSINSSSTTLTAASALFTDADIGRTIQVIGAGSAGAVLNTTITAVASSTECTVGNAASTTVTSQPNFRYRVLDTDLIEVDGLILARTWRQANRAADTLNQTPYLHFVDMHYQSTNMTTKQRNGPAFYT